MQVSQGNNQGVPPFGGLNPSFSNPTSSPPIPTVQTYPHQMSPQQSHVVGSPRHPHLQGHASTTQHQQAYAIRFKERQLQQRLLQQQQQQQQQQFAASSALMPHVQSHPQLPISSSSLQNSSQVQPQNSSALTQSSTITPLSQHQQKLQVPPHGLNRNHPQSGGSGLTANQMGKQRPRQQQQQQLFQQSGRHHPQQRQQSQSQSQSQQQAKLMKGVVGRGNMLMHQNVPIDPSLLSGLSTAPGSQSAEKAEQVMQLMQGQGLYPGPGLNHVQPPKPLISPRSPNRPHHAKQKMYSGQAIPPANQTQQMPSHSDISNQGHGTQATSGHTLPISSHQAVQPLIVASTNHHQQLQTHQKLVNQTQPSVQRVFQQNRQLTSDPQSKLQADQAQTDQQTVSSSSQMGTTGEMPQASIDTSNVMPVVSSSNAQWKSSEQLYDSGPLAPIGNPPLTNSSGSEPMPVVSQGVGPPLGHAIGAQRQQQQQSQLQPPSTSPPPLPQQQQQSPQKQLLPPQQQSQQQTQHLQAGNSSLYMRPINSRPE
ncbi:hypothetical protein U1Q18_020459 [Sarracenia purpurea var. burkii]